MSLSDIVKIHFHFYNDALVSLQTCCIHAGLDKKRQPFTQTQCQGCTAGAAFDTKMSISLSVL